MKSTDIFAKTIRIVAPSGALESPNILDKATARLSKLGYWVELDPQCQAIEQRFAGSDELRAQALQAALKVPDQRIVMAARGGYGAHRILPMLNWTSLARSVNQNQHQVVGHSDITAIHMALFSHGAPSFAGPCAGVDFGGEQVNAFMKQQFQQTVNDGIHLTVKAKQTVSLDTQGVLWGGNLAILCSLLGTPYFPSAKRIKGGILFLEDVNERPFRVERMINQLYLAGVLSTQSVIVMGDFGVSIPAEYDRGYGFDSVLHYMRHSLGLKVLTGLPFGHISKKATLPVGTKIRLQADNKGFQISV